jgi:hypothetical protein
MERSVRLACERRQSFIVTTMTGRRTLDESVRAAQNQPQVALPLARVMVMWPIVVSALAPCQWRSPALT